MRPFATGCDMRLSEAFDMLKLYVVARSSSIGFGRSDEGSPYGLPGAK